MPTAMHMRWEGVTLEQYDAARELIDWEGDLPDGAILHVASYGDDGFRVFDIWESAEHFQRFVEERLRPGVEQVGIEGEPEVHLGDVHRMFAPRAIEAGAGVLV